MSILKVWIEDGCIGCGFCEETCESVFMVTNCSSVNLNVNLSSYEEEIIEADMNCPVAKIKVLQTA